MTTLRVRRMLLACALVVAAAARPARAGIVEMGEDIVTQIVLDPADFLYDIQLTNEDRTPLPVNKFLSLGFNIFPNMLPFTELGLDGKARLHREHGGWPQVDLRFGGWSMLAGSFIPKENFEGSVYGMHGGISAAVSLDPRLRVFAGYQWSAMFVDVKVHFDTENSSDTGTGFDLQNSLSSLTVGKMEHFIYLGSEMFRSPTKRLVSEIGYGVVTNKLMMRLTWASKHFDTGLAFYPEGAWVLWPFANFQVRF